MSAEYEEMELEMIGEWESMYQNDIEAAEEALAEMEAEKSSGDVAVIDSSYQKGEEINKGPSTAAACTVESNELEYQQSQRRLLLRSTNDDMVHVESEPNARPNATERSDNSRTYLHTRPDPENLGFTCTLSSGERFFLRKAQFLGRSPRPNGITELLDVSVATLLQRMEKRQIENVFNRESDDAASSDRRPISNGVLWIDKYRPKRFIDLLSDEKTNRETLRWLKSWDEFVFRRDPTILPAASRIFKDPNEDETTSDTRPEVKVLLIAGPPGAGKTTLGRIIALHAGYNPIEVNASDDRTPTVLRNKIVSAMEMGCIWGEQRPNCLILDEIDGALNGSEGRSAVSVILDLINTPLKDSKKSGRNSHPLVRPLICICNDQFAPVLRPLRKVAIVYSMNAPDQSRIMHRLKTICKAEGISAASSVLATLSDRGENDIRYCVNALQLASQSSQLTMQSLNELLTKKDRHHGYHDTWNAVFFQRKRSRSRGEAMSEAKYSSFERIYRLANNGSKNDTVLNGLHENMARFVFNDPTLSKTVESLEWLEFSDFCLSRCRTTQEYALLPYVPVAAVSVHYTCCSPTYRRLEFPRRIGQTTADNTQRNNIVQSFAEGAHHSSCLQAGTTRIVMDILPWLRHVLCPTLKSTNRSFDMTDDRQVIDRLIQLLAYMNLSFKQQYNRESGERDLILEPAIHTLCDFSETDVEIERPPILPLKVRQSIAREIELESMRRAEGASAQENVNKNIATRTKEKDLLVKVPSTAPATDIETLRKMNPFAFAYKEAQVEKAKKIAASPSRRRTMYSVRFKFNQGHTRGIRRAVKMSDLL